MLSFNWIAVGTCSVYTCTSQGYIDFDPWYEGGTLLTNFELHMLPIYVKAVEEYAFVTGDTRLFIADKCSPKDPRNGGSLHCVRCVGDLGDFWKNFFDPIKDGTYVRATSAVDPVEAYNRAMGVIKK